MADRQLERNENWRGDNDLRLPRRDHYTIGTPLKATFQIFQNFSLQNQIGLFLFLYSLPQLRLLPQCAEQPML